MVRESNGNCQLRNRSKSIKNLFCGFGIFQKKKEKLNKFVQCLLFQLKLKLRASLNKEHLMNSSLVHICIYTCMFMWSKWQKVDKHLILFLQNNSVHNY